jgi:hypothetical protein
MHELTLAELLPGIWAIAATNLPVWLTGERAEPHLTYELVSREPLVLSHAASYTSAEDAPKPEVGHDTFRDGQFVRRGTGLHRIVPSRWEVSGWGAGGAVLALRYFAALKTPAGLDIVVRERAQVPEIRALVAGSTDEFGLTPEEFGSLSWLAAPGSS